MKLLLFCATAILFLTVDADNKHYYVFKLQKLNWHSAFADCLSRGLQMATITSSEDQAKMSEAVKKAKAVKEWLWIGATDQGEEGSFLWLPTGKAVSYNYWGKGQPDSYGNEDCVNVWEQYEDQFRWNDQGCDTELIYICEDKPPCECED